MANGAPRAHCGHADLRTDWIPYMASRAGARGHVKRKPPAQPWRGPGLCTSITAAAAEDNGHVRAVSAVVSIYSQIVYLVMRLGRPRSQPRDLPRVAYLKLSWTGCNYVAPTARHFRLVKREPTLHGLAWHKGRLVPGKTRPDFGRRHGDEITRHGSRSLAARLRTFAVEPAACRHRHQTSSCRLHAKRMAKVR